MALEVNAGKNDTSAALNLIRFLASFAVLFGHAISFFSVAKSLQAPFSPYMQNVGVLVFFVLSGFLIAFVLDRSKAVGAGFGPYLIDRFARIYSGLVPSMIAVAAIDIWLVSSSMHQHPQYVSAANWLGSLAMLNGYRDMLSPFLAIYNFGSAGQLWTLAIEVHLYVCAGALVFAFDRGIKSTPLAIAIIFCVVPVSYLSFAREPGAGIVWLWLMGAASFHAVKVFGLKLSRSVLLTAVIALAAASWIRLAPGKEYDMIVYLLLATCFTALVLLTQQTSILATRPNVQRWISYCADFSFTLYLVHYTILYAVHQVIPNSGWTGASIGIVLSLAVAILLAHLGEKKHKALANKLKLMIGAALSRK